MSDEVTSGEMSGFGPAREGERQWYTLMADGGEVLLVTAVPGFGGWAGGTPCDVVGRMAFRIHDGSCWEAALFGMTWERQNSCRTSIEGRLTAAGRPFSRRELEAMGADMVREVPRLEWPDGAPALTRMEMEGRRRG